MSELLVNTIKKADGSGSLSVPAESGTVVTTASPSLGRRNLVQNGSIIIDQRNGGSSITPTNGQFGPDRWSFNVTQSSKMTAQQVSDGPVGFEKSLKITSSSAYTPVSGDYFLVQHHLEGNNVSQLELGTADAQQFTLSFWVKSSLTGTFGGAFRNFGSFNRTYIFEYTISSANTWEQKTVTVTGDTTGTWNSGTSGALSIGFSVGAGSSFENTAGSWVSAAAFATSSSTDVVATNGATWQITGVQLEVGSVATPFEHRSYGEELLACQRYYYAHASGDNDQIGMGHYYTASYFRCGVKFNVTMRANPSIDYASGAYYAIYSNTDSDSVDSLGIDNPHNQQCVIYDAGVSGGTVGHGGDLRINNANGYVAFDAEL